MKKILKYVKNYIPLVVLSLIFATVSVIFTLYAPILTGRAIDLIIGPGQVELSGIKKIIIQFAIVSVVVALAQWFMNIINNRITFRVVKDIRVKAFNHLETLPLKYIDGHSYGDIVSRIVADADQFSDGLLMGFSQLFTGVITIIGTLCFMFTVNIWVTIVVIVLTPLSLLLASFIAKKTYHLFVKQSKERAELTGLVDEMVGNEKVVQAFSYEDDAERRFEAINNTLSEASLKATFFSSLTNPSTRLINNTVYAAVGIMGGFMVITGKMSVGQLTCFLSYATQYAKPFNEISGVITELQNAIASANHVFEVIEEEPEVPDAEDAYVLGSEHDGKAEGSVEIQNVNFSYDPEKKLIEDLNLSVKPGQRIAIVGPTGCGKSTVINLLMRFYDVNSGSISVDGHPIKEMTRKSLRKNYGMVLQETWLKSGTVRENITYGKPDATDEEIIAAAKLTHAHSFIRRLPDGYDTYLTEDGGSLSQGQKQLLCITRVMLSLPPMLILDEATSSIDTRTEHHIQNSFAKMMKGRTSFIVAHRLSTIKEADRILVMKDGNIIEQGTHEELILQNGFYHDLYFSQFETAEQG